MSDKPRSTKHRDATRELWGIQETATPVEYKRAEAMMQDSMEGRMAELKDALEDLKETFMRTREGRTLVRLLHWMEADDE